MPLNLDASVIIWLIKYSKSEARPESRPGISETGNLHTPPLEILLLGTWVTNKKSYFPKAAMPEMPCVNSSQQSQVSPALQVKLLWWKSCE